MTKENRAYDAMAQDIYDTNRNGKEPKDGWPHFHHLTRFDRDYYRALAQIAKEDNSWPEPKGDF